MGQQNTVHEETNQPPQCSARDNIILVGMPASGKSTVGVILAKVLAYDFIDTDILIQRAQKKSLAAIIGEKGIDEFLRIENQVCSSVECTHSVIATGGSAIYGREAMEHFGKIGIVIYLKVEYDALVKRLHNIQSRGVVLREGQSFRDLYEERTKLYEKYAGMVVEEHGDVEDVIVEIVQRLSSY